MTRPRGRVAQVTCAGGIFVALAVLGVSACSGASARSPAAAPAPSRSAASARAVSPPPGATPVQHLCAGQCGPPYELAVVFRPRTSSATAAAILRRCGTMTVVIKTGQIARTPSGLSAVLFTRVIGARPRSDDLLRCLHRSGAVAGAGWPD